MGGSGTWRMREQKAEGAVGAGGRGSRRHQKRKREAPEVGGSSSGRQQERETAGAGDSRSGRQQERETSVGEVVEELGTRSLLTGIHSQLAKLPAVGWAWVVVLNVTFIHSRNKSENVTVLASHPEKTLC